MDEAGRFFVKPDYQARAEAQYFDDLERPTVVHQPDVYRFAAHVARRHGVGHILDIGCGNGDKLAELSPEFRIVGVDFGSNLDHCRATHPQGSWHEWDLSRPEIMPFDREVLADAVIINSDVIEHLVDPRPLLLNLAVMLEYAPAAIISTPERDLVRGPDDPGPPANPAHVREWNETEFAQLLAWAGLPVSFLGLTRSNDDHHRKHTILAVVDGVFTPPPAPAPSDFDVQAIVTAYNEADIIGSAIEHLTGQGIRVHVIDNHSTDETFEIASRFDGRGVTVERFPDVASTTYDWTDLLVRVEQVAAESAASWCIHHDADEVRESPWPDLSLRDALWRVDRAGFTAVDHTVVEFHPVDDGFVPGSSPAEHLRHWAWGMRDGHMTQLKAWRHTGQRVRLAESGGHDAAFLGRRIAPHNFLLRHYPIRSQAHGEQKVHVDRAARWNPVEKAQGWHKQYDDVDAQHDFLRDPADLQRWDRARFAREQLTERLARVGRDFQNAGSSGDDD